jgi:hypothetical protein
MAKLPGLVTAMAEVDGRDRKTIEYTARTIRERGYITNGKRGAGSPDMTARDAANLVMALNGADLPKDSPIAIDRFRSLRQWWGGTANDLKAKVDSFEGKPDTIQAMADCRTFGEALEVLIDGVPDLIGMFYGYAVTAYTQVDPTHWDDKLLSALRLRMFGLEVTFSRYSAEIEVFTMIGSERRVECSVVFGQDSDRPAGFYGTEWPDRKVTSVIGMPTLIAAFQALNPERQLPGIPARGVSACDEADGE